MRSGHLLIGMGAAAVLAATTGVSLAEDVGVPKPGAYGYQDAATESMRRLIGLSVGLHWVAAAITVFVTILLGYTCWRFSEKRNPVANRFSHNTTIEVAWTLIPVLILVAIAYPSIKYLYYQETVPPADVTVKAVGISGWYWRYEYVIDGEDIAYDSYMAGGGYATYEDAVAGMKAEGASDEEIPSLAMWKLKSTAPMVVPVNSNVTVEVTSDGLLHAFAVPAFGVKADAVPGTLHRTWFNVERTGTFYGQCSELCGRGHSYMPIEVEVVEKDAFVARLKQVNQTVNGPSASNVKVAATELVN